MSLCSTWSTDTGWLGLDCFVSATISNDTNIPDSVFITHPLFTKRETNESIAIVVASDLPRIVNHGPRARQTLPCRPLIVHFGQADTIFGRKKQGLRNYTGTFHLKSIISRKPT